MSDFLLYMLFSSIEFLSVFFLIFCFFNLDLKYFRIEILLSVLFITFLSYILVRLEIYNYFPLPFILIPVWILVLCKYFKQKLGYSFIVVSGSSIFYGFLQVGIFNLAVMTNRADVTQINDPFTAKTFVLQTLCATIATTIAFYVKLSNGGFGFSLRRAKANYKKFIVVTLALIIFCLLISWSLNVSDSTSVMIAAVLVLLISSTIFFYFSYRRDQIEYS